MAFEDHLSPECFRPLGDSPSGSMASMRDHSRIHVTMRDLQFGCKTHFHRLFSRSHRLLHLR
ncbi:hypothetical protein N7463_005029 [Penicillium fimorum]|uniref:Uncharacterized protein n=1 Tax=Penicillium fimorum TaxID=1882269 RepID=A0A9W9XTA1_9EURO|nr:hypothetical protein N7463_005029 [Penicillium fimorum]